MAEIEGVTTTCVNLKQKGCCLWGLLRGRGWKAPQARTEQAILRGKNPNGDSKEHQDLRSEQTNLNLGPLLKTPLDIPSQTTSVQVLVSIHSNTYLS